MLLFMKSTLKIINTRGATDRFFGKDQFYRDLWKMSSHIPAPLLELVRVDKKKLDWTDVPQKALENIEKVISLSGRFRPLNALSRTRLHLAQPQTLM